MQTKENYIVCLFWALVTVPGAKVIELSSACTGSVPMYVGCQVMILLMYHSG